MKYLILILFFVASFFKVPEVNGWAYRQAALLGVLALVIGWELAKKFHLSVGLCFIVTAIYGLLQQGVPQFGSEVVTSLMALLFFSCIALSVKKETMHHLLPILAVVAIGDSIIMLSRILPKMYTENPWAYFSGWWVLTNGALDSCFLAIMTPVIWSMSYRTSVKYFLISMFVLTIVLCKSNTGLFVLSVVVACNFLAKKEWRNLFFIGVIGAALYPVLYYIFGSKFLESSGRFVNWRTMMTFWNDNINHVFGSGPGSYWMIAQYVQAHHVGDAVFSWMHNDWLQVLFEQGYVGLTSIVFLFISMLYKSFNRPKLFSMIFAYGVIGCTLYPLHLFMFQILGTALIYLCFTDKNNKEFNLTSERGALCS